MLLINSHISINIKRHSCPISLYFTGVHGTIKVFDKGPSSRGGEGGGGGGRYKAVEGGGASFTPTKKGAETVLAMLKGEGTKRFWVVLTREL